MAAEGLEGRATMHIQAPPEKVYGMITDVARMGEWSPESAQVRVDRRRDGPRSGRPVQGSNKRGILRWSTKPTVTVADRRQGVHFRGGSTREGRHALELQAHAEGRRDRLDRVLRVAPVHLVLQDRLAAEAPEGTAPAGDPEARSSASSRRLKARREPVASGL